MVTDAELDHIATLARIELTHTQKERFKKELSSILEYIDKLDEVDTSGVAPLYQVTGLKQQTRKDIHRGDFPVDEHLTEYLITQAPMHQGRLIKVKAVKRITNE